MCLRGQLVKIKAAHLILYDWQLEKYLSYSLNNQFGFVKNLVAVNVDIFTHQ